MHLDFFRSTLDLGRLNFLNALAADFILDTSDIIFVLRLTGSYENLEELCGTHSSFKYDFRRRAFADFYDYGA